MSLEGIIFFFIVLATILLGWLSSKTDRDKNKSNDNTFEEFKQNHPELQDPTTIQRIKKFIAAKYTIHLMYKELYRLYLRDCDEKGKPALSYSKWKFAYGL